MNLATNNFLTHKVNIHFNVLGVLMLNGIVREIHDKLLWLSE